MSCAPKGSQLAEEYFGTPDYADGFAHADSQLRDTTRISFDMLASGDQIVAKRDGGAQLARAKYQNTYAWLTLDHEWSSAASSRIIGSFTDLENERRGSVTEPLRTGQVRDDRTFHIAGLRWENSIDGGLLEHRFGAEVRHLWGDYRYDLDVQLAPDYPFPNSPD